ncbi:MAG: FKBP-type peptidyl-prolyl cis-trans isomerase [Rikenellaceae bacterium]
MAKGKIERKAYRDSNKAFLIKLSKQEDIHTLDERVLYRVIESGDRKDIRRATLSSVVLVRYRGRLVDGTVFDSTMESPFPEAMRLRELIVGWQIALQQMVVGDRWEIFIPYNVGYGDKGVDGIPAYSTLIFDIKLEGIN